MVFGGYGTIFFSRWTGSFWRIFQEYLWNSVHFANFADSKIMVVMWGTLDPHGFKKKSICSFLSNS